MKIWKRRSAAWLLAMGLAATALWLPASAAEEETQTVQSAEPAENGWVSVASSDRLELYTAVEGDGMGTVAVKNKTDGTVWYTCPPNARDDRVSIEILRLLSLAEITVYDSENDTTVTLNSYSDCVSEGALTARTVKNGVQLVFAFPAVSVSFPVEITLDGETLSLRADMTKLKEEGHFRLLDLTLMPYFCSGGTGDTGYLLIPDGSGALLRFNNGKTGYGSYSCDVYGGDAVSPADQRPADAETVAMPVFGAVRNGSAMLAMLTDGAAHSTVKAVVSGVDSEQNTVWHTVHVRRPVTYSLDQGWQGQSSFTVYPDGAPDVDAVGVRYAFLSGGDAGLSGMAAACRSWLSEQGLLQGRADAAPVVIDMLGAVRKKTTFLGFPAWRDRKITDFSAMQTIAETLTSGGVDGLSLRCSGWEKNAVHGKIADSAKPLSLLGGSRGLYSLGEWAAQNGAALYADVNWQQYSSAAFPFQQYFTAARNANNELATRFFYSRNLLVRDKALPTCWLLGSSRLQKTAERFLHGFSALDVPGLSLSGVGALLYSDHGGTQPTSAEAMQRLSEQLLDQAADSADTLMTVSPFLFAAVRSDLAADLPGGSRFDMLDETVPFYALVLSGSVAYCGRAINLEDDPEAAFLTALATGSGLHYALTADGTAETLKDTAYEDWIGCAAADWTDTVIRQTVQMRETYAALGSSTLIGYEQLADGVSRSTFAGGGVLLVNTNDHEVAANGVTLAAKSFQVQKGGEAHD